MEQYRILLIVLSLSLALSGCTSQATATSITVPTQTVSSSSASITVIFDLAGGGSGFSLTIYAQEVNTGLTYSLLYSSSAHGQVVLPTSPPVVFNVEAPGTYVFYANMLNAPEDYHFGFTGCGPGPDCALTNLKAIDVLPHEIYQVYFSDRSGERHAPVPTPHAPLIVEWER